LGNWFFHLARFLMLLGIESVVVFSCEWVDAILGGKGKVWERRYARQAVPKCCVIVVGKSQSSAINSSMDMGNAGFSNCGHF
jgi:hypothetical protein